jgi:hypothetical protein
MGRDAPAGLPLMVTTGLNAAAHDQ